MSVKTQTVLVCDGYCGKEALVRNTGGTPEVPQAWAVLRSERGAKPGRDVHLCPRCHSIVIAALWHEKARSAVLLAVEIKEVV